MIVYFQTKLYKGNAKVILRVSNRLFLKFYKRLLTKKFISIITLVNYVVIIGNERGFFNYRLFIVLTPLFVIIKTIKISRRTEIVKRKMIHYKRIDHFS